MMYCRTPLTIALGMGLALCAACSGDDDDGQRASGAASSGTRTVDVATAQQALDELAGNVDTTVTGFSADNPAAAGTATQPGTTTSDAPAIAVRCNAGGEARVGGYVNVVPVPVLVDVKVAIAYDACITPTGTTIAGNIEFSQSVAAGPGTPLRVETLYQGDVTMKGRVNVTCPVDLNVLVDEAGRAIQVGGTFCGQSASALKLQVAPRWQAR